MGREQIASYRRIMGWYPDGSGKDFKRCKVCGCYREEEEFNAGSLVCRECRIKQQRAMREYMRSIKVEEQVEDVPTQIDPNLPTCRTCKRYSSTISDKHAPERGWCMKWRKGVYGLSGCGEHKPKFEGRYEQEARQL